MKSKTNIQVRNNIGQHVIPNIIIGGSNGYSSGDILDANATVALINDSTSGVPPTVASDINEIKSKIPTEATSTNQLADKAFVNSSIATNTATFKGTYNSLSALQAVSADANDYGFVIDTDSDGNTLYKRYKYTDNTTGWVFEYTLNNSSFTAAQWASIQSGITAELVTKLNELYTKAVLDTLLAGKVGSTSIRTIVTLTQAQYDALATKDANTEYNIIESV